MQTVLRFQPVERRGITAIGIHNSRGYTKENLPEHIDLGKSHLNKVLVGPEAAKIPVAMQYAIAGIPVARKMADSGKDLVMAECLLSASPEFFQQEGATEAWTKQSVDWLKKEFGDKLLSAVLHMDEQTPHIHAVIRVDEKKQRVHPVTKELMPAKQVLCYSEKFMDRKEVLTKARVEGRSHLDTKLGRFQTRYAESVSSLGLSRGRESARTKDKYLKHTATQEWRDMQQLKKEVKQIEAELGAKKDMAQKERDALEKKIVELCTGYNIGIRKVEAQKIEIQSLEKKISELRTNLKTGTEKVEAQQIEIQGFDKKICDKKNELHGLGTKIEAANLELGEKKEEAAKVFKGVENAIGVGHKWEDYIKHLRTEEPPNTWKHLCAAMGLEEASVYIGKIEDKIEVQKIAKQCGKEEEMLRYWEKKQQEKVVQKKSRSHSYEIEL